MTLSHPVNRLKINFLFHPIIRMNYQKTNPQLLQNWFKTFAETECKETSPLYYQLAHQIATDSDLIQIAAYCQQRQPIPNLFLAAVHFLLLKDPSQELAQYYPSLNSSYRPALPFDLFKQFCLEHSQEIIAIEQSKIVQTNVINRCAYLMPIIAHLYGGQQINVIDIGTSAGLTLNFDRYEYHYSQQHVFGKSPITINSEIKAGRLPECKAQAVINHKIGLDQNPLDLNIDENALWLKALTWADLTENLKQVEQAILIARQEKLQLLQASTLADFAAIIDAQDVTIPLFIYHTHVLYQFTPEERANFWALLDQFGQKRNLTYLAAEDSKVLQNQSGVEGILVEITQYQQGKKSHQLVAETNGHGNWIKWNNENLGNLRQ